MDGIAQLREANTALAAVQTADLSDTELGQVLVELHREEARLAAVTATLTAAYDIRRAYAGDGSRSASARLARDCNTSLKAMRQQVLLARRLRLMPEVAEAFAKGDIDVHQATVLGRLADSPRKAVANAFPDAETRLLGYAKDRGLGFHGFVHATRYWSDRVDEEGAEDDARSDHESRHVYASQTLRGNVILEGQLDALQGTEFLTALRRIEKELFESDWAAARLVHGDATRPGLLARTPRQRRADALVEMARRAMTAPADGQRPRPLITVVVDLPTMQGQVCELFNRIKVTPGQVATLLTEADVERAVFAGKSRIIDLGAKTRFFTGATRRAMEIRDRGCRHPTCDEDAEFCEGDHIQPYSEGGATVQSNGELLCPKHNRERIRRRPPPEDEDEAA
jgi:hypothetical protein